MSIPVLSSQNAAKKPLFFYGYIIVAAALIVLAVQSAAVYSFGIFLKPVSEEFDWTRSAISGAHSLYMFLQGIFYMITGRLTDRFGPRLVMTVCGLLFGLGFLLISSIDFVWQLYLFWGVMSGIGASGGLVPMVSTVARWFTRKRGLMTGIVVAGVSVGTMIGPPVASQLILSHGWRMSYLVLGATFLVLLMLSAQFLRKDPGQKGLFPNGDSAAQQVATSTAVGGFSLNAAFHTRQFWMLFAMYALFGISQMLIMTHIVPFATDLGISPVAAATIMIIIGGVGLGGRIMMGGVADRIGNKPAFIAGMALMAISMLMLQRARETWSLYLFGAVLGFGYGGEIALMSPVVAELFGLRALGTILGVISFAYFFGCAIGPILAGAIFDMTGSYYIAFATCAVFSIIGLALVILIKPIRDKSPEKAL